VKLTAHMADALTSAQHAPLRRVHRGPGAAPWPAPPVTLRTLIRRGLIEQDTIRNRDGVPVDTWTITDAGRAALQPPEIFRQDRPTFLADHRRAPWCDPNGPDDNKDDYTTDPGHRIDELEIVDEETQRLVTLRGRRADEQRARLAEAGRESQPIEERLSRIRAEARDQGVDIARQEASIVRRIEAIERRVRKRAA
jgi:DNA-binding PadR family transcriptional regulator